MDYGLIAVRDPVGEIQTMDLGAEGTGVGLGLADGGCHGKPVPA